MVISKTSAPDMANDMVRFHLLMTPETAYAIGTNPVLASISNAIIRPNISRGVRVCIRVIERTAFTDIPYRKCCPFLHPLFIRPHRKNISHEHNPDAPRERNPDVITERLT